MAVAKKLNMLIVLLAGGDRHLKSLTTNAVMVGRGGCHGVRMDLSRFSCLAGKCRPDFPSTTSLSLRRVGMVDGTLRLRRGSQAERVTRLTPGIHALLSMSRAGVGSRGFLRAIMESCRCCTLRRV